MFIDDEKRILSEYVYNDSSFKNGISNFEIVLIENLNQNNNLDKIYKYNREDEQYLIYVYERVILFIVNLYFNPTYKTDRKYLKNSKLYICYYIYQYFNYIIDRGKSYELDYFREKNEEGYYIRILNNAGKVAIKTYLASALYLNKEGIIADYNIENIKDYIKENKI